MPYKLYRPSHCTHTHTTTDVCGIRSPSPLPLPSLFFPPYAQGRILMEKGLEKKEGGEERRGNAASKIKFWIWMTKKS